MANLPPKQMMWMGMASLSHYINGMLEWVSVLKKKIMHFLIWRICQTTHRRVGDTLGLEMRGQEFERCVLKEMACQYSKKKSKGYSRRQPFTFARSICLCNFKISLSIAWLVMSSWTIWIFSWSSPCQKNIKES